MPIGKNALKRVSNNGYSAVKTSSPDMENSTVIEPMEEIKVETKKSEGKKSASPKAEKTTEIKSEAKKPSAKKPTLKKTVAKPEAKESFTRPDGFVKYGCGADLPVHLL